MSELTTIARPYAKAAFDYAVEQKATDQWLQMLAFAAEVSVNDTVKELLTGSVASEALADVFIKVCGDQLDDKGQNLIKLLAENGRLTVLPDVLALFVEMKAEFDSEIEVTITSAVELSDTQKQALSGSLEKRFGRKVQLVCNVDATLVAGVIIEAGDTVIDGSVRSKLGRLATTLQA
jgi:F-type H+-transporting ATPase subunit delta